MNFFTSGARLGEKGISDKRESGGDCHKIDETLEPHQRPDFLHILKLDCVRLISWRLRFRLRHYQNFFAQNNWSVTLSRRTDTPHNTFMDPNITEQAFAGHERIGHYPTVRRWRSNQCIQLSRL